MPYTKQIKYQRFLTASDERHGAQRKFEGSTIFSDQRHIGKCPSLARSGWSVRGVHDAGTKYTGSVQNSVTRGGKVRAVVGRVDVSSCVPRKCAERENAGKRGMVENSSRWCVTDLPSLFL